MGRVLLSKLQTDGQLQQDSKLRVLSRYREGREAEISVTMRSTLRAGVVVVGGDGETDGVGGHELLWEVQCLARLDCTSHNNILPF